MRLTERDRTDPAPARPHIAVWLALAVLAGALAAYGAWVGQSSWEVEATQALQAASPAPLRALAEFMTAIGRSPVYPLTAVSAALVFVWLRRPSLAVLLAAAALLRAVSPLVKDLVDRPRPSPALVDVASTLQDPSFPSGHVLGATLLYGFLVYAVEVAVPQMWLRRSCQAVLVSMIALMGYARVELGEHWPTDVLGGWAVGLLLLLGLTRLHRVLAGRTA